MSIADIGRSTYFEHCAADPGEVHQHDPGVDPRDPIERVACKAAIPAYLGHLMLWGHGGQLGAVELLEEGPDVVHGSEEQHVCVHIEQRVHLLEDYLGGQRSPVVRGQSCSQDHLCRVQDQGLSSWTKD